MGRSRWAELALVGLPLVLLGLTLLVLLDPGVAPALVNQSLDLVLGAAATLVAVAVAILSWIHYRENADRSALLRASAFLVLAAHNLLLIAVAVYGASATLGFELSAPGQLPIWSVVLGRGLAVVLFIAAGLVALHPAGERRLPALVTLTLPTLLFAAATAGLIVAPEALPALLDTAAREQLRQDPTAPLLQSGGVALVGLQATIGLGFLACALISYRVYRRNGREAEIFLAIGFVVAAFSQLHSAIHPGSYLSLVTTGDLLRVGFYAVLLLVMAAEARADIRAVRAANAELIGLREAELARATAEERARLAREIHDGMSQELWYAKLKQSRLTAMDELPADARRLAEEVATAIDSAQSEARQAIAALRPAEGASFAQVLQRYVDEFADRFGIPAECTADDGAERLAARGQAELLRIVQEALTNVRRHADATRVRVTLGTKAGGLHLTVADNGRGFEPGTLDTSGYGLRSMRERAAIVGARLRVESQPSDGTRVIVEIPAEAAR